MNGLRFLMTESAWKEIQKPIPGKTQNNAYFLDGFPQNGGSGTKTSLAKTVSNRYLPIGITEISEVLHRGEFLTIALKVSLVFFPIIPPFRLGDRIFRSCLYRQNAGFLLGRIYRQSFLRSASAFIFSSSEVSEFHFPNLLFSIIP